MANPKLTHFVSWISCVGLCGLADYLDNRRRRKETANMSNSQVLLKDLTWLTQQPRPSRSQETVRSGSSSVPEASVNKPVQTEEPVIFEPSGSPYYPPPCTFMPPESPDMHKHQSHALPDSSLAWYNGLPTPPSNERSYNGVKLAPGQSANLTIYGRCLPSVTGSTASSDSLPSFRDLPHKLPSELWASSRPFGNGTAASQAPGWGSNPPNQQSNNAYQQPLTGPISFPELARKEGVREWNSSVFDNRWMLRPEEMANIDPRRQSVVTIPPTAIPEVPALPMEKSPLSTILHRRAHTHCAQSAKQKNVPDYSNDPLGAYAALVGAESSKKAAPAIVRTNSVPVSTLYHNATSLPEVRRLMDVYHDHGDARSFLPRGVPYTRDTVRNYLYSRVFDFKDTRALTSEDALSKVLYGGNIITRCELHTYLFSVLDHMAEDMTVPRRHGRYGATNELRVCGSSVSKMASANPPHPSSLKGLASDLIFRGGQLKPDPSERIRNGAVGPGEHNPSYSVKAPSQPIMERSYLQQLSEDAHYPLSYHRQQLDTPERHPATYYQNAQSSQQLFGPVYVSHRQSGNPVYIRQQAAHAVNSPLANPLETPFQATRPAAPQRLAPSILRAGALELNHKSTMFPDFTPTQPYADLAQPLEQRRLSISSASTEIFQPKTYLASYEPNQIPAHSVYSASSSSSHSRHLSRDYIFPDSNPQYRSVNFPTNTDAAHFNPVSRRPTPARIMSSVPITQCVEWEQRFGSMTAVEPVVRPLTYHPGFDVMKSESIEASSVKLQDLTRHGKPTYEIAINQAITPFEETAKETNPPQWGVLKISNIPYSLTRAEVVQFLGRNAKLVTSDFGSPVHIIMDRSTGKTNDCYVEFFSVGDAQAAVNRLRVRGHQIKIGTPPLDRVVTIDLSSQDFLLKELFPRAKNVLWKDGIPIIEKSTEPYNSGFKAFVTGEEMVMLVRHAEQPHRSSYTQKCPQRTFETMISTLTKFPWHAVQHYTVITRNQIFAATRDQVKILVNNLKRGGGLNINQALLTELMIAGLNSPGFSESQRWELVQVSEYVGGEVKLSPLMKWWPWEALGRKAGSEEDVVQYYASLLKSHPSARKDSPRPDANNDPFGNLPLATITSTDICVASMEEIGRVEWAQLQGLLRDVLG